LGLNIDGVSLLSKEKMAEAAKTLGGNFCNIFLDMYKIHKSQKNRFDSRSSNSIVLE